MAKPLGPRVTVAFGKNKQGKAIYVYMLEATAKYFGFSYEKKIVTRKNKKGRNVPVRGSVGAKHIKLPTGKTVTRNKQIVAVYKQIPVPASANISQMGEFCKKASKNKPKNFVTPDGRTWSVG